MRHPLAIRLRGCQVDLMILQAPVLVPDGHDGYWQARPPPNSRQPIKMAKRDLS
jgi:hypothetical protein